MIDSGIYIRVGTKNMLLESLSDKDLKEFLDSLDIEGLKRTITILCHVINYNAVEYLLDKL